MTETSVDLNALETAYQDGTLAEHLNEIPDLVAEVREARKAHRRLVKFIQTADIGIEQLQELGRILLDWPSG